MISGITLWNLDAKNIVEKIKRVSDMGFQSVSFLGSSFDKDRSKEVADTIKEKGLIITFHLSFFGTSRKKLISGLEYRLGSILEFIEKQGLKKNLYSIGFDPAFIEAPDKKSLIFDYDGTVHALKRSLQLAEKSVKITVENWTINSGIQNFISIAQEVDSKRLGMLLDVGHFNIAEKKKLLGVENREEFFKRLPLRVFEVHLHDNDGNVDLHMPLGSGNTDVEGILGAAKKAGRFERDTVFTIEVKPKMKNLKLDVARIRETVVSNKEFVRGIVEGK
jgi:sugar phosphate isomerase/epimerase